MADDDDLGDATRLLDVVLEEELGPDPAAAIAARVVAAGAAQRAAAARAAEWAQRGARRRAAWSRPRLVAAALLLLGIAAVAGSIALRRADGAGGTDPAQGPTQDPTPPTEVQPKDLAEFLSLVRDAVALRVERREAFGATQVLDAGGAYDRLDTKPWPEVVRCTGERLAAWQRAIEASSALRAASAEFGQLAAFFELPGYRVLHCSIATGSSPRLNPWIDGLDPIVPDDALTRLVAEARLELELLHRRANGIAHGEDELAALPADCVRVETLLAPDGTIPDLGRFTRLQSLVLHKLGVIGVRGPAELPSPGASALRALRALPRLHELDLPADAFADDDVAALAALPAIERLVLRDAGAPLTGAGFAAFGTKPLRELTLWRATGLDAAGMRAIARVRGLRTLRLLDVPLGDGAMLLELPAFVALRELAVKSRDLMPAWLAPVLRTRLEKLVLVDAAVGGDGLAALGGLPSLRELELVTPDFADADVGPFAALRGLRHLRLQNVRLTADGLATLRELLPDCAIECTPGARLFDSSDWFRADSFRADRR
jgi:hypothetical protein